MSKFNLLIADDDPEDLGAMIRALDTGEYEIHPASSGSQALRIAETVHVEITLLDILLPDLDGYSLCKTLRRQYYMEPLQILLVSNLVEEPYLTRALEVGGDDFIKKPFNELELQVRLRGAAIRYRSQLNLLREREFYRQAVKQEEELSSRILDQNLTLKKAYENMEVMNRELERLNKELARVAKFDVLSGLMNRMSLFGMIDVEIERALRSNIPLCGIMLDIDHFKDINDNHGHQCGDEVIRLIGHSLRKGLRKYDHAGRYGGEEFFVLLPNTTLDQAEAIAERFRLDLKSQPFRCAGEGVSITASLGIAQYRTGESKDMWIARADRAMYAAKQRGRDQVVVEGRCAASS